MLKKVALLATLLFVCAPVVAAGASGTSFTLVHGRSPAAQLVSPAAALPLAYHGGPVMLKRSLTYAIFWHPAKLQTGAKATYSANYQKLIRRYFQDAGGNSLYANNTQYYQDPGAQHIVNSSKLGGTWVDTSAFPASGCTDPDTPGNCVTDRQIQDEISKAIAINGWTPSSRSRPTVMFFVFPPKGEGTCYDAGPAHCSSDYYCSYHSNFVVQNESMIYANLPYPSTVPHSCSVPASPNGDIDADTAINLISIDHMEAVTDPDVIGASAAWFDNNGLEIAEKCTGRFGTLDEDGGLANQSWNGHFYLLQQEWSNATSGCVQ